ncbi:50S ribosomal subunit protein L13 [Desulfovibrionales bacterium]
MKTWTPALKDIKREWFIVDASGQILGRMATQIANRLRGKHKPEFAPHIDNGDFIILLNAGKIAVTGNKLANKRYYSYSGYIGGLKSQGMAKIITTKPEEIIRKAVRGMLPKTRLGRAMLKKLKIYTGIEHPHVSQNPKLLKLPY